MTSLAVDHVAIAVPSIEETGPIYELITGNPCSAVEPLEAQGVRVAFVGALELLEPTAPDTPVGRFLARRGPGLHHVAFRTSDLGAEVSRLKGLGFELIDREPRPGAGGHRVAFLHPRSTGQVLVELVERPS